MQIDNITREAATVGLEINIEKTKSLRIVTNNNNYFHNQNNPIECVEEFCYVGSMVTSGVIPKNHASVR